MSSTKSNQLQDRYKAKRLRFLINGDKYFQGFNYALNTEKIRNFDSLLDDLTIILSPDHLKLCKGVRHIFDSQGNSVTNLADFQHGNSYLCSSTPKSSPSINLNNVSRTPKKISNSPIRNSNNISSSKSIGRNNNIQQQQTIQKQSIENPTDEENINNRKSTQDREQGGLEPTEINNEIEPDKNSNSFGPEVLIKYDIGSPIGDGHFSVVYCSMNKTSQQLCALKLIDKSKCRGRDDMIYNEVKILKQLSHPNIVKLIEEFDYSDQLYLILELVQDGDLFDAISTVTKFAEIHVSTMIHNLSSALTYLHKQGIVHRDIKPENLLISIQEDGSYSLKLADFGLAVQVDETQPLISICGTAFYVSPEMLNESGYDYKVDVWSTGVICFILLCGYPPFTSTESENDQEELFNAILAGEFQFAPPYWSKISQHAKELIKCMLNVDPDKRYTAEQVFTHPWTMGTTNNFEPIDPMNISRKIASKAC